MHLRNNEDIFADPGEIESLVHAFEACAIAPAEFGHRQHLAVAMSYLTTRDFDASVTAMRTGLMRFLAHHEIEGYHETITLFWLKRLRPYASGNGAGVERLRVINEALAANSDAKLIFTYFSRERVMSDRAKREWVEPDLRAMEA